MVPPTDTPPPLGRFRSPLESYPSRARLRSRPPPDPPPFIVDGRSRMRDKYGIFNFGGQFVPLSATAPSSGRSKRRFVIDPSKPRQHQNHLKRYMRKCDINAAHRFWGHLHEANLRRKAEIECLTLTGKLEPCEACCAGKMQRRSVHKISTYTRAKEFGERIYMDTTGPFKTRTGGGTKYSGRRYAVVFVDDATRSKKTYLTSTKSAESILDCVQRFHTDEILSKNRTWKCVRSDSGTEYLNMTVVKWLCAHDIVREYTSDYTPQHNAVVEVAIRDIKRTAITLMNASHLHDAMRTMWGEAFLYATDLLNYSPCAGNPRFESPNSMLGISMTKRETFYQWGSLAFPITEDPALMENKSKECLFVGFARNKTRETLRFLRLDTLNIIESKSYKVFDGIFLKPKEGSPASMFDNTFDIDTDAYQQVAESALFDKAPPVINHTHDPVGSVESTIFDSHGPLRAEHVCDCPDSEFDSDSDSDSTDSDDDFISLVPGLSVLSLPVTDLVDDPMDIAMEDDDFQALFPEVLLEEHFSDSDDSVVVGSVDYSSSGEATADLKRPRFGSANLKQPRVDTSDFTEYSLNNFGADVPDDGKHHLRNNKTYSSFYASVPTGTSPYVRFFVSGNGDIRVPKQYAEALRSPQWQHWRAAIQDEYDSLVQNGTWRLVPRPSDHPVAGSRWVFTLKFDSTGNISRYKARFVCKGYTQTAGVDYFETFAPVVNATSLRILLAMAARNNWDVLHMDVKTAFLNAPVDEKIYVQQPQGFVVRGKEGWVLELLKSLYGLRQAPRNWNKAITDFLLSLGFVQSKADSCLFYHYDDSGKICLVSVYVDDILLTGDDVHFTESTRAALKSQYVMSDLGEVTQILGMIVTRDRAARTLKIHHAPYIQNLETLYDVSDVTYNYSTPASEDTYTQYLEAVFRGDQRTRSSYDYRAVIGCLVYLANSTRPDIANITRFLSGFVTSWTDIHVTFAQRVLKYLYSTPFLGLCYSFENGGVEPELTAGAGSLASSDLIRKLEAYTDASWADNYADATSTSGFFIMWAGCLISWKSIKQKVISQSSMEAEFIAMNDCLIEIKHLVFLLEDLCNESFGVLMDSSKARATGLIAEAAAIHINGDNTAAIMIGNQDVNTRRSRMVNTKFHLLKEAVVNKLVSFRYVNTKENLADIFTKCLGKAPFLYLRNKFMS